MSKLIALRLPDELADALTAYAKTKGQGVSEIVRGLIEGILPDAAAAAAPLVPRRPSGLTTAAEQSFSHGRSKTVVVSPAKRVSVHAEQILAAKAPLHVDIQVGRTKPSPGSLLKSKGKTKP